MPETQIELDGGVTAEMTLGEILLFDDLTVDEPIGLTWDALLGTIGLALQNSEFARMFWEFVAANRKE
jgi:hypothetical protein